MPKVFVVLMDRMTNSVCGIDDVGCGSRRSRLEDLRPVHQNVENQQLQQVRWY